MDSPRYILRNYQTTLLYFLSVILQPVDITADAKMPAYKRIDTHGKTQVSLKDSIKSYEQALGVILKRNHENKGRPVVKKRSCRWGHELNKDTLDTSTLLDEQMMVLWNIATLHLCVGLLLYCGKGDTAHCGTHFANAAIHYKWLSQINFTQGFLGYNTVNRFNAPKSAFCEALSVFALSMQRIDHVNAYMRKDKFNINAPEDIFVVYSLCERALELATGAGRDDAGANIMGILRNHKSDMWYWHDFFSSAFHFHKLPLTGEEPDKNQNQAVEYMYYVVSYCGNIDLVNMMTAMQNELIAKTDKIKQRYLLKVRIMAYNYIVGKSPEISKDDYQKPTFDIDVRNTIKSYIE